MKRLELLMLMILMVAALAACSGANDTGAQGETSARQAAPGSAQAETADTATLMTAANREEPEETAQGDGIVPVEATAVSQAAERPVDLDLTNISGTVVYSQVYDMMVEPENYMGLRIKMKGSFSYYRDPDTKQEYFAAVIADATACCAQGIEFVWEGEHSYPWDYPPLDTEITVTGTFGTYFEGDYMYIQLADAQVEWEA